MSLFDRFISPIVSSVLSLHLSSVDISAPLSPLKCFTFSHSLPILLLFSHPVSPFSFSVRSLSLHLSWGLLVLSVCLDSLFPGNIMSEQRMLVSFPAYKTDGERKQERFGCGIQKYASIQKPQSEK